MPDALDPAARSALMARIRAKDTAPELWVRRFLHGAGFRYRLHARDIVGCPDIVLPKHRVCVFVNGCFWHAHRNCAYARAPQRNAAWWADKLARNVARDQAVRTALKQQGWRVIDIWECGIKDVRNPNLDWLVEAITSDAPGRVTWPRRPRKAKKPSK